ncbi:MAG: ATP-dependent DNA helicase RecQ [Chloroflexi bacterium]|nr:ATP-dependent DNA helicase RecQ [Chloroflexota bacterium]
MGIDASVLATLQAQFGFDTFRPGQAAALDQALAGRDVLVVMPTGSGKSLIYQLAALFTPGTTLVISPLIALMKDQVDRLERKGIAATYINSSLPPAEQRRRLTALAEGVLKLVYIAPERLRSNAFHAALRRVQVGMLAVDEAHCISQWGHDFRPDYLLLGAAREALGNPPTLALTATATPQVQDDIVRLLQLPQAARVVTGFNRPNLTFEVRYTAEPAAKLRAIEQILRETFGTPKHDAGIIYTGTRKDAEEVSGFIQGTLGLPCRYYHAGLDADTRSAVQEEFIYGELPLVVATNAFGMGVDRADLRFVIHFSLPGTLEAYYQEAGRAGRDGKSARCTILYAPQDRALQEWFIDNDAIDREDLQRLFNAVRQVATNEPAYLTAEEIAQSAGLSDVQARVGLSQLESAGAVRRLGDVGPQMQLQVGQWNTATLEASLQAGELRREYRYRQLDAIVAYAEGDTCRRRVILRHFGDQGPVDAPSCCDNCLARERAATTVLRRAESQAEWAALVILEMARDLPFPVGRKRLASVLKGSHHHGLQGQERVMQHRFYAKLGALHLPEIEGLIDQLLQMGYLKLVGGQKPVVRLTPEAQYIVAGRGAIPLHLPREIPRRGAGSQRQIREMAEAAEESDPTPPGIPPIIYEPSAELQEALFEKLREWRLGESRTRQFPTYIIFHDSVLREVARRQPENQQQLGQIKGVGPGKLDSYGEALLEVVREFKLRGS